MHILYVNVIRWVLAVHPGVSSPASSRRRRAMRRNSRWPVTTARRSSLNSKKSAQTCWYEHEYWRAGSEKARWEWKVQRGGWKATSRHVMVFVETIMVLLAAPLFHFIPFIHLVERQNNVQLVRSQAVKPPGTLRAQEVDMWVKSWVSVGGLLQVHTEKCCLSYTVTHWWSLKQKACILSKCVCCDW